MSQGVLLLWVGAIALMGSPGPATLSLAGAGSAFGVRASLPWMLGIVCGTTCVLLGVATGVSSLVALSPLVTQALSVIAAIYLLYVAWTIATAPVAGESVRPGVTPSFMPAFALAVANPKAWVAIGAVYSSQVLYRDAPLIDALVKVGNLAAAIVLISTVWLGFGAAFARIIRHPRLGRAVNVSFAVLLVVAVLVAVLGA